MHAGWMALRTLSSDQSVKNAKLKPGTLKRIFAYAIPYKSVFALFLICLIADAVLTVATPLLLRELIDNGVIPKDRSVVTTMAVAVALLAIASALVNIVVRWISAKIGEGLIYDLRSQVFRHVQEQSIAFFTRTQTGALISRINSDVIGAQRAFTSTFSGIISNVLTLVLVVGTMLALSWQITVASLLLLPIFLAPTKWIGSRLQGYTRDSFEVNAQMSSTMTERFNVSGALLVKLYGDLNQESKEFKTKARKVADIGISMAMLNTFFFIALISIAALATAIAYGIGGHLAIDGSITVGSLIAITTLLARLYGPLVALATVRVDVMGALVSFERVFEVLDLEPMVKEISAPKKLESKTPAITFNEVRFTYPKAQEISLASLEAAFLPEVKDSEEILKGISFEVKPGTVTALVGPSGAGKTTISALLPRLYDVTGGCISIDGEDIRNFTLNSLRGSIGVVMQDSHLFHATITENLRYAKSDATLDEMKVACEAAQIWDLVSTLPNGLETMVGERGHRLSGGEKQRLAIARLLLKSPSIVILDEATAHLDSENEELVQKALAQALYGRTSIVIAHRLSTVMGADQIIVLENGSIVERGKHEELVLTGGLYSELFARQDLTTPN
ncbi:ATP-binding cassette, subfamily B, bacterial [Candidatus Planktophila lacus]|uniref:ATP-binding cassette, subfamily B, bacterial n=2 Tax=Candidatus Planktophila lacus TaxID=1884913 RepID=A0AAD0E4S7_9ACTN|nr:ATP-binding cassette, subfamily B, bacterial [Candidatus Planktophila lacus]ASY25768.1 ATP-binding cassette, subfamily B, bacterial [Candidatus Planktophila lacus]